MHLTQTRALFLKMSTLSWPTCIPSMLLIRPRTTYEDVALMVFYLCSVVLPVGFAKLILHLNTYTRGPIGATIIARDIWVLCDSRAKTHLINIIVIYHYREKSFNERKNTNWKIWRVSNASPPRDSGRENCRKIIILREFSGDIFPNRRKKCRPRKEWIQLPYGNDRNEYIFNFEGKSFEAVYWITFIFDSYENCIKSSENFGKTFYVFKIVLHYILYKTSLHAL
jgi:hypothetical protein